MNERVTIDWAVTGPTQGAANLVEATGALDIAQGSEVAILNHEIQRLLTKETTIVLSGAYNGEAAGTKRAKELIAKDFYDSFRINVKPDHVFAFNGLGRTTLEEAYKVACEGPGEHTLSRGSYPSVIMPDLRWQLLANLAKDNNFDVVPFEHFNPDLAAAVEAAIKGDKTPKRAGAVLINFFHNPTGLEKTPEQIEAFMQMMDRVNEELGTDIHAIFDLPYNFGGAWADDSHGRYIKTGFENILNKSWKTKWVLSRTAGKELALSAPGLAVVAASDNYPIKRLTSRIINNGKGLAYNGQLVTNVAEFLGLDENAGVKWGRRADLHGKYTQDSAILAAAFPGNRVPGGPNMLLEVLQFRRADLIGRTFKAADGEEVQIVSGDSVVECLGNDFGVVPVHQTFNNRAFNDMLLLRVAKKLESGFFGGAIERLQRGLGAISGKSAAELAL